MTNITNTDNSIKNYFTVIFGSGGVVSGRSIKKIHNPIILCSVCSNIYFIFRFCIFIFIIYSFLLYV